MFDVPSHLHDVLADRYVLKREIGRGGAASVFLAHDVRHERLVAVKLLHPELSHALGAQRFLREIKLTASLQHPHILPIHDSGQAGEQLYYVMPYVTGDTLRQRLVAGNRLSIEETVRIGREVAGALAYAHENGVVHRDIKPENILFSGGHAVLADFGIARAIDRASEKITQQGTITGTPAYMSPEQARDRAFDGRSDVYSLACVMYEAMAGVPPFVGDTPQELLTQRVTRSAPSLREFRHDVPAPIEAVIARALATSPDDRFEDARAFSAALSVAVGNSSEIAQAQNRRRPLARNPWVWAAGVTLLVSGGAATSPTGRDRIDVLTGRIDTAQYAVIPFKHGRGVSTDDEPVAQGLYVALREWSGVKLASDLSVSDALRHSSDSTLEDVLTAARRARAGKAVWGSVFVTKDSMRIRASVYNSIDGTPIRERSVSGPADLLASRPGILRALVNDLLRADNMPASARSGDAGTRNLEAWRHYQLGQRALSEWRVEAAMAAFTRASTIDPTYAHAHLWLAQLQLWRGDPMALWSPHASAAMRARGPLDAREGFLLDALLAVQRSSYGDAALAYRAAQAIDSLDPIPLIGIAFAQWKDPAVLRDPQSPSGWRFRGSVETAQRAYQRALQLAPGAFALFPFDRIERLFNTETSRYRAGQSGDSAQFVAFPELLHDTLAYVPHPYEQLNIPVDVLAPTSDRALRRNRDALLAMTSSLTQRLPDNPDVFESLAHVLESRDEIVGTPHGGYSALSALERAITLATDSVQRARLGATNVRLHIKLGDFARAAALGDSILQATPVDAGQVALYHTGVAALLGKEQRAVRSLRASGESLTNAGTTLVPILEDLSTAFYMRAALGVCDDSLRTMRTRLTSLLDSYVATRQRNAAMVDMMSRPLQFGLACFGPEPMLGFQSDMHPLVALHLLARHDTAAVRASVLSRVRRRTLMRAGDVSLDLTVTEAWISAALGDSAAAARQLDLTLTALPTLTSLVLYEPGMAASLGRSMVMRADLAAHAGDAGTAALWASRVLTLWSRSDPDLAPTLARMRALAAHRSVS